MPLRDRYSRLNLIAAVIVFASSAVSSGAAEADAVPTRPLAVCEAEAARVPPTIQVDEALRRSVGAMLKRSPTFRGQCRRLAGTRLLYVRLRINGSLVDRSYRARTVVQRFQSGVMIAIIEIRPFGPPDEWIAHEFEHVLEQVDGVRLVELAGRTGGVWRTAWDMFETERAIRAGRAVAGEMRGSKSPGDTLVE